jgi:hypothetical protein
VAAEIGNNKSTVASDRAFNYSAKRLLLAGDEGGLISGGAGEILAGSLLARHQAINTQAAETDCHEHVAYDENCDGNQ